MQDISPIPGFDTPNPGGAGTEETKREDEVLREQFLTLFMAQLKNQDPLSPMDNVEFTSQIAQFSQLEQLFNLNEGFDSLMDNLSQQNSLSVAGLIGKEAVALGDTIRRSDGIQAPLTFYLNDYAGEVKVNIYDSSGLIRTVETGGLGPGAHELNWNGTDFSGSPVPDGLYYYQVEAKDAEGNQIPVDTYLRGTIDAVSFEGEEVMLSIDGRPISMGNLLEVHLPGK